MYNTIQILWAMTEKCRPVHLNGKLIKAGQPEVDDNELRASLERLRKLVYANPTLVPQHD